MLGTVSQGQGQIQVANGTQHPRRSHRPALRQAEAITLLADGRRYAVSSEQRPAPLWVLSLPD